MTSEDGRTARPNDFCSWGEKQVPITPTNKAQQADTLIIAAALQNFAQDSERNISDMARAEELREQVLAYGASMCKPVTPTESTGDLISRQEVIGYIDRLTGSGLGKRKSLEYIKKYVARC